MQISLTSMFFAHLFELKHLLVLREQLQPFQLGFRAVDRELDFSSTSEAIRGFITNIRTCFL